MKWLFLLNFFMFLYSCSHKTGEQSNAFFSSDSSEQALRIPFDSLAFVKEKSKAGPIPLVLSFDTNEISILKGKGIFVSSLKAIHEVKNGIDGITLEFYLSFSKKNLQEIKKNNAKGLSFVFSIPGLNLQSDRYDIKSPVSQTYSEHFAFADLHLEEGENQIPFLINFNYLVNDGQKESLTIDESLSFGISFSSSVECPKLYELTVEMDSFELNTKISDPAKFDYSFSKVPVFGELSKNRSENGYPDLVWIIFRGDQKCFRSPVELNKTKYTTPTEACVIFTKRDKLVLSIMDEDNMFDDKISSLTIDFNKLKYNSSATENFKASPIENIKMRTNIRRPASLIRLSN